MTSPKLFDFEVSGSRRAAAEARRALRAGDGTLPESVRDDVLLLVTELVTNAIRHSDAEPDEGVRVEVRQWSELVNVAVFDQGTGFQAQRTRVQGDNSGGWGLYLVDQIADSWAITPTEAGACVWFEIGWRQAKR